MKICGLKSKVLTNKKVGKPNLVSKSCREGREIQKQYMFLQDSESLEMTTQPSVIC